MDLAQALGAPEPVAFAGAVYPVRALKLAEWAGLTAYLKTAHPSPVTTAVLALQEARALGVVPAQELVDQVLAAAQLEARAWPPKLGSRAWLKALDAAPEGTARFVLAVLTAGGTDLDLDRAGELARLAAADQDGFDELVRVAYFGDPPRPKADGPAAAPTATAPTTAGATTGPPPSTP